MNLAYLSYILYIYFYYRGVPDPKLRIYDAGKKKADVDAFPYTIHLVSLEKE